MKLLLIALLAITSTTTVQQEQNDHVSKVPPAALFPYYTGMVSVNQPYTLSTVKISAFSGDCGIRYLSQVQKVNHAMVAMGLVPASIEIDESAPGQGVDNCVDLTACMTNGAINIEHIGPLPSLHHYSVFTSIDGKNLKLLIDLAPSATGLYLTPFAYDIRTKFYIKAVGQPLMRNHFLGPITACR